MTALNVLKNSGLSKRATGGVLVSLFGLMSYFSLDSIVNIAVRSQLNLDPNGQLYPHWQVTPIALTYKLYIFSVENPNEVLKGEKLRVSERGPYALKVYRRKEIIKWAPDRSTVTYYDFNKFEIDYENTIGSWSDVVTIINPVIASFGGTIRSVVRDQLPLPRVFSPFVYGFVNALFATHREGLFIKRTVRELVVGKRIEMLDTITNLFAPLKWIGIKPDFFTKGAIPKDNMFGIFAGKNNTPEGPFEVYTGLGSDDRVLQTVSYKGQKKLNFWKSDRCNMINGSDGSMFKLRITPEDELYMFIADLCRSVRLKFLRHTEFMGISALEYDFDDSLFDGIDTRPENECYCTHKNKNKCRIDGLLDLGGCQFGSPILMTTPHFLGLPHLLRNIDGLNPNETLHESKFIIQPDLGMVIYALKRLMVVVRIEGNSNIRAYGNVRSNYFPLIWIEVSGGLNDDLANKLKYKFIYPTRGASIATAGIGMAGVVFTSVTIWQQWFHQKKGTKLAKKVPLNVKNNNIFKINS